MFRFAKGAGGATLVVSIGSASVSLGIVERAAEGVILRASARIELPLEERPFRRTASALARLLCEKGEPFVKAYAGRPSAPSVSSALAVLHSPWSRSKIVSASRSFGSDRLISDALLDECARQALGTFTQTAEFLSANLLRVRLNGYPTERPEGKHAHSIEIVGLVSAGEDSFKGRFSEAVRQLVPGARLSLRAGASAIARAARPFMTADPDSLTCYLSGEGTEIIVAHEGIPAQCAFIPIGIRSLLALARPKASPEDTLAALRADARGDGSEPASAALSEDLLAAEPRLAQRFGEHFARMAAPARLPVRALLIAPPEIAPWFARFLGRIDFTQFTLTARPFDVQQFEEPSSIGARGAKGGADLELSIALALLSNGNGA